MSLLEFEAREEIRDWKFSREVENRIGLGNGFIGTREIVENW